MEHPDIRRAMQTGYPTPEHLEWEREQEEQDHPVEDMFGTEILPGDNWFADENGNIVLMENAEDYLIEVLGVEVIEAKK